MDAYATENSIRRSFRAIVGEKSVPALVAFQRYAKRNGRRDHVETEKYSISTPPTALERYPFDGILAEWHITGVKDIIKQALSSTCYSPQENRERNCRSAQNRSMAPKRHSSRSHPFSSRAESEALPALSSYLLSLVSIKQSNLCVSADVHTTSALLRLADEVGDSICVLKTHVDIIDDFSDRTIKGLQEIAKRKYFLIFEDRKFGDIG
ncbi:MAG: hypothetical protein Q9173_007112, partial [Seirophora scorigena]